MKKSFFIILALFAVSAYPQDVIRIMHYNMMYYDQTSSYCTATNNPLATKDASLQKIIDYVQPDIFTANEVAPDNAAHQHILATILNVNEITHYQKGTMTNLSGSDLSNAMFYNSDKLGLLSQNTMTTTVRDINIYNFYYKAYNLPTTHDTAYLTCIIMHLKAGSTTQNASERATQTNKLMTYLNSLNKKANYLAMGDFNVYTASEACFQNLVNYSNADIRFYDPVNMMGDWNSNYLYCNVHTQSTHVTSTGCFSTGGMDDRFDFILESEYIKNGTDHFHYADGSYMAIGQDGNHLNKAINYGTNNSAPDSIIEALYNMSDHLPVVMNLNVNQTVDVGVYNNEVFNVSFQNPVTDNLNLSLISESPYAIDISIFNLLGQKLCSSHHEATGSFSNITIPLGSLQPGFYLFTISDGKHKIITRKFIKR